MSREMTLSQAVIGTGSTARKVMMVLAGSAFIAVAAQISVPMLPVPMTLQTLAILMVGFAYGSRLGAVTLLAYLAEGAMGLPVFANGMNGLAFAGPTAGFLLGFVAMAWAADARCDNTANARLGTQCCETMYDGSNRLRLTTRVNQKQNGQIERRSNILNFDD